MRENTYSDKFGRDRKDEVRQNNIQAAQSILEAVKSTLGPKGMDKMMVDGVGNITITNDGATILKEMEVEHPVAKILTEIAKTQEEEAQDGTTTTIILAAKILENSKKLLEQGIHPTIINKGYRTALKKSLETLKEIAIDIETEIELTKIAETAMTGKGVDHYKEQLSAIIVEAVKEISEKGKISKEDIKIERKRGLIEGTELIKGIVLDRQRVHEEMPTLVRGAKILLLDGNLENKNPETDTRINITEPKKLDEFLTREKEILKSKAQKIIEVGANVVIIRDSIDPLVQYYLAKEGIYVLKRVLREDLITISRATNAKILSNIEEAITEDLGNAEYLEEKNDTKGSMAYLMGCKNPKSLTLLIRSETEQKIQEVERAIKDSLGDVIQTLQNSKVIAGGGATEIEIAKKLTEYASTKANKEALAIIEYTKALEFIPKTLLNNAGLPTEELIQEIKKEHQQGNKNHGINLFTEKIENTANKGIIEPLNVKQKIITNATEVAMMILRIDDIIAAKENIGRGGNINRMMDYE